MSGMKIAMAVPYFPLSYSFIEQAGVTVNEVIGVILNMLIILGGNGNANLFFGLSEVLIGILANNIQFAEGGNFSICFSLLVKAQ